MIAVIKPKKNRKDLEEKRYSWATFAQQIIAAVLAAFFIFPIMVIINNAFKTKQELYFNSPLSLPANIDLTNFTTAWNKLDLGSAFFNSFVYTTVSVVLVALLCTITAWAIARGATRVFRAVRIYFLVGILIPSQALSLPIYLLWNSFGLINTRFGLIALYVSIGLSFGIFLQTNFMSTVPVDIEEAAQIDGCNVYHTFFRIVLPLLKAPMATLVIVQSFSIWNDYMLTNLVLQSKDKRTVILAMKTLFTATANDYSTAMAAIVLSATPIIILFVLLQKQFIKGMLVGAVKG